MAANRKMRARSYSFAGAVVLALLLQNSLHAGIIDSGHLLTVSNNNVLRSFTFTGALAETLAITGLGPALTPTGVAQGVAVVNGQLFVGLVSTVRNFEPKIVEVDPITGGVLKVFDTMTPQITALGDDGTNLLLLDSVNVFDLYTYTTAGTLVGKTILQRPPPPLNGHIQGEGIDGDGQSVFAHLGSSKQAIVTNDTGGLHLDVFELDLNPSLFAAGGLAFDPSDQTLYLAVTGQFRQYSQAGDLLAVIQSNNNVGITGLEVIASSPSPSPVPEPSSLVLVTIALVSAGCVSWIRRRGPTAIGAV